MPIPSKNRTFVVNNRNMVFNMPKHFIRALMALFIIILPAEKATAIDSATKAGIIDSIKHTLATAVTPADSISKLYAIFDLCYGAEREPLARQIYGLAKKDGDQRVCLDILRHIANINWRNDSVLDYVHSELARMPQSPELNSSKLFVSMLKTDNFFLSESSDRQTEKLKEFVRHYTTHPPENTYERADLLYALCRYLSVETRGELLEDYIDKLDKLVEEVKLPVGAVRRMVYNRAAPIFYENENYPRALEMDRKLLKAIDSLEIYYAEQGRQFHNAPTFRYVCYRRMLGSYSKLSRDQIEEYYGKINVLAKEHPNIAYDLENLERAKMYYAMATDNYSEAIKIIKRQLDNQVHAPYRLQLLKMLKKAAKETGDNTTLLEASDKLADELQKKLERTSEERSRELKLLYDMSELRQENNTYELERHQTEIRTKSWVIGIGIAVMAILATLVVLLAKQNKNNKLLTASLKTSNDNLREERDGLRAAREELIVLRDQAKSADRQKTEFINNMSHEVKTPLAAIAEYSQLIADCIPEKQNAYLNRFASIIRLNVRLVMRLVNDVLDIASLEHGGLSLEKRPVAISTICELAINNVFENGKPDKEGLMLIFNPSGKEDHIVDIDGQRVAQILINLLKNAEKFTDAGTITFDYDYDETAGKLSFSVADTGIGIPKGKEDTIFSRFRQLDISSPGCGLGLYISRLLATLMKGSVTVDTRYRGGARFVLQIPIK